MLVIRNAQMEVFSRELDERFRKDLLQRLGQMRREGRTSLAETELAITIESGLAEAVKFDLRSEADVARYVELACQYFGGFRGAHPKEAVTILKTYGAAPSAKLDRLESWCHETGGRSAARR